MNIRGIVDKMKAPFDKGQKLEKLYPAFNAFETFLFVPNHTTDSKCHVRDSIDLKRTMATVIVALIPCLLFGCYNIGYQYFSQIDPSYIVNLKGFDYFNLFWFGFKRILPMIIVSYGVGLSIEFAFSVFRKHPVNEGYLVTGMLIPLIFPIDCPLWILALSVPLV